jgi:hypothetical protein
MSLHRVDPRFVLPHSVRRAVVLDGLEDWRAGLASAGIDVFDAPGAGPPADVVVAPARLARQARDAGALSVIVEGSREKAFLDGDYEPRRLLLRPTRNFPSLALPLDQPVPVSYALKSWSIVDRRWKTARMQTARVLVSRGLFPSWASPIVTVATQVAGPPSFVAAAGEFGVPGDASWFLTFGQGDVLSRNAFQLFRRGSDRPEWVLKFARVPGYAKRFDNDERGLRLALGAGAAIAAHAPRMLGRFDVDGVHASLESAAGGRRLRDILRTPGDRKPKEQLIERIADWIIELGRLTRTSADALRDERERLRREVVPQWEPVGAQTTLVDELPNLSAVAQHNDLGTWNVVADDGEFVVLDWENLRKAALPLWDLLYFLADAFALLDWPEAASEEAPEQLPERIARLFAGAAPSSPLLFAWVRRAAEAAAIPPDAVGAIATLCWLSHSLSAAEHNRDLAVFTPHESPRLHGFEGIAQAWMAHPLLGPRWSAWRG